MEAWTTGRVAEGPSEVELEYVDVMLRASEREGIDVIFPSWDPYVAVLSRHRATFAARGIVIPVPDFDTVLVALDKQRTIEAARASGFPCPHSYRYESPEQLDAIADAEGFPLVVKPRFTSGSRGMAVVRTRDELQAVVPGIVAAHGAPLVQEYIPGGQRSSVQFVVGRDGTLVFAFQKHRHRTFRRTARFGTVSESTSADERTARALPLVARLGLWGAFGIETIRDPRDGVDKLMEVNPRFPRQVWNRVEAGINEPLLCVRIARGEPVRPVPPCPPGTWFVSPVEDVQLFGLQLLDLLRARRAHARRPAEPRSGGAAAAGRGPVPIVSRHLRRRQAARVGSLLAPRAPGSPGVDALVAPVLDLDRWRVAPARTLMPSRRDFLRSLGAAAAGGVGRRMPPARRRRAVPGRAPRSPGTASAGSCRTPRAGATTRSRGSSNRSCSSGSAPSWSSTTCPGPAASVGARAIADAAPDGLTLGFIGVPGLLVAALAGDDVPDPTRFTILGRLTRSWHVWATGRGGPFATLGDVIAAGATRPLVFAVNEVGSTNFVSISVAAELLGVRVSLVPGFGGTRQATLAALRGDVDLVCFNFETIRDLIEAGELRPLLQVSDRAIEPHSSLTRRSAARRRRRMGRPARPRARGRSGAEPRLRHEPRGPRRRRTRRRRVRRRCRPASPAVSPARSVPC